MRRSASEIVRNLEMRIARLERQSASKSETAIETSSERELEKAWPNVSYQGEGRFLDTYMKWIRNVEAQEIGDGLETDLEDEFSNTLEVSGQQECYLGYNQKEDYFVMGFDLQLYSPESATAYQDHQDAMEEYREALEEWEESDMEDDEPIEDDFRGYDYDYEGVTNPEDGIDGWATVTFKASGNRVKVLDVKIESEAGFYNSFDSGFDTVKREHRGIIHLRLD